MSKQAEFAVILKMNPMFAELDADELARISSLCHTQHLGVGEVLFQKGDSGDALFGIRRGQIRIETGAEEADTLHGRTIDLSTSGGRLTVDGQLTVGDVVVVELPGPDVGGTLRLPSLVWEAYTGGAVVVFANLARAEYLKLRDYLGHFA